MLNKDFATVTLLPTLASYFKEGYHLPGTKLKRFQSLSIENGPNLLSQGEISSFRSEIGEDFGLLVFKSLPYMTNYAYMI